MQTNKRNRSVLRNPYFFSIKRGFMFICMISLFFSLFCCGSNKKASDDGGESAFISPQGPSFNADSAYLFCQEQCAFGPRTMNSSAHDKCSEWIMNKFRLFGLEVTPQRAMLTGYDGTQLNACNIMASFRPELSERILLCAHWDSRPWADNDPDSANWHTPIIGANDGASGVAVMLEIARLLQADSTRLDKGIDFVCFDAEDWGLPLWSDASSGDNTWALGAQYWAVNLPEGYIKAQFGILLDMVGGQGAQFWKESASLHYASSIVEKVWTAARTVGFGSYFPNQEGGMITDDHLPINEHAGIPTIDVIPYYPDCEQSSFGPTWHTISDDMEHIDKNTLKAVGQTIVQVLYE